jgi:hypothetical protein
MIIMSNAEVSPVGLHRIRLELARERGHPEGSATHRYDVVAPLDGEDHLDAAAWRAHRDQCRVVHTQPNADKRVGHLVRRPGGSWAFRFPDGDDEPGLKFNQERFVPGEYVSLRVDDEEHTYRIVAVGPV